MIHKLGKLYYRLKGYYPVNINDQRFKGDAFHLGFWRIVNKGGFEPHFFNILDDYLSGESVYCDIGSWIGPTVMYASRKCKQVFSFEPDSIAHKFLLQNIYLNKLHNVTTFNLAIAGFDGIIKMASHGGSLGDSMTSMVNIDPEKKSFDAICKTWETWLKENNHPKIDFLKMDIEGGEFDQVVEMKDFFKEQKPIFHLSTHSLFLTLEERKIKMEKLIDTLSFYSICYDENRKPIKFDLSILKESLSQFRSFLFLS
jgi:FkbM family methyltransferase